MMKTNKSYLKFRFAKQEQHLSVRNSHTTRAVIAAFDGGNLVLVAGLVLVMKSAEKTGLRKLADKWLNGPTEKGGSRMRITVASMVGGMISNMNSISHTRILCHGGMGKLFGNLYGPSTPGLVPPILQVRPRPSTRFDRFPVTDKPRCSHPAHSPRPRRYPGFSGCMTTPSSESTNI